MQTHVKTFKQSIITTKAMHNVRLDLAMVAADIGLSRRKIRTLIDLGAVFVNKKRVRIASRAVQKGEIISFEYNDQQTSNVKRISTLTDADILFDNYNIVAINKPANLPATPTKKQAKFHVTKLVEDYFKTKNPRNCKLTLVHRLDQETSGVILLARTKKRAEELIELFRQRKVLKTYLALSAGKLPQKHLHVKNYLSHIIQNKGVVEVARANHLPKHKNNYYKEAITDYYELQYNHKHNTSLIRCFPKTGRSHQLRAQLNSLANPILGDKKYGHINKQVADIKSLCAEHHLLHAHKISFKLIDIPKIEITAPPNKNFIELNKMLKFNLSHLT